VLSLRAVGPAKQAILFPAAEHDDLFDGLQTMVEGAMAERDEFGAIWL
jgi:hypothetical protein